MKLNLVHRDLKHSNPDNNSVQKIANKWGFMHMGHFSGYYTKLFGENPSKTLLTGFKKENRITSLCIDRQEEII